MAFLKPQSPLVKGNDYFYPLTTADQVIMDGGYRLDQIVGKVEKSTVTLYQNGWSAAAPYSYSIVVNGLADDLNMQVFPHYSENFAEKQALKEEFAKVSFCSRQGNIVTFECWDEVPNVDIDVDIEINVMYPIKMAVDEEIEARLPKLNYSIVGGTVQPSNPTENMIWINTDTEITKVIFRSVEPSNPIEGMVCIYTWTSSNVSFDRIIINGIGVNEVYPTSVKQYVSGAWAEKTAKSYQNGEWVDWATIIYAYGSFSEGYSIATNSNADKTSDTISFTEKDGYIQLNSSGDLWSMFYIAPKVIRGECKTLYITIENASMNIDSGSGKFGLSSNTKAESPSFVASTSFNSFSGNKTISVDISQLPETDAYYIAIRFGLTSTSFSARVTKIWME